MGCPVCCRHSSDAAAIEKWAMKSFRKSLFRLFHFGHWRALGCQWQWFSNFLSWIRIWNTHQNKVMKSLLILFLKRSGVIRGSTQDVVLNVFSDFSQKHLKLYPESLRNTYRLCTASSPNFFLNVQQTLSCMFSTFCSECLILACLFSSDCAT